MHSSCAECYALRSNNQSQLQFPKWSAYYFLRASTSRTGGSERGEGDTARFLQQSLKSISLRLDSGRSSGASDSFIAVHLPAKVDNIVSCCSWPVPKSMGSSKAEVPVGVQHGQREGILPWP